MRWNTVTAPLAKLDCLCTNKKFNKFTFSQAQTGLTGGSRRLRALWLTQSTLERGKLTQTWWCLNYNFWFKMSSIFLFLGSLASNQVTWWQTRCAEGVRFPSKPRWPTPTRSSSAVTSTKRLCKGFSKLKFNGIKKNRPHWGTWFEFTWLTFLPKQC